MSILIETPFFDQGILFGAFALQGTIHYQEQDPVVRRWESRQGLAHQPLEHHFPRPTPAGYQPPQVPPPDVLGRIAAKGFTSSFLKTDHVGHYLEPKDQKVAGAEHRSQRLKKPLYFFGQ